MKIAIFVDKYGTVLPFFSSGVVEIYSDETGAWKCIHQVVMDLSSEPSMNEVLRNVRMLVSEFDGCNLLVLERIQGIVRSYLSDFRIGIWMFKGLFVEEYLLNHIKLEVEKAILAQQQRPLVAAPVLIGKENDAVYEIDLARLLDCDVSLILQDVLIPFFQSTNFRKLIIISKQSPTWLEQALKTFKLLTTSEELAENLIRVTVIPEDFETGLLVRRAVKTEKISDPESTCTSLGCGSAGLCISEIIKAQLKMKRMLVNQA
jgi:Fe-only nitrogenase accessory protein AnfO